MYLSRIAFKIKDDFDRKVQLFLISVSDHPYWGVYLWNFVMLTGLKILSYRYKKSD